MSVVKTNGLIAMTPGADHRTKEGYFVKLSAGNPIVVTAVTDVPFGVLVDGENTDGADSVAVPGAFAGTVHVKLSGTVAKGATLQLAADGTCITDAGTGARVLVATALEGGDATELVEAALLTPIKYS